MPRHLSILGLVCLACSLSEPRGALATDWYVPTDHATIQAAIDAATAGDTIWVAAGEYFENIDFAGKSVRVVSEQGPDTTIIDGSLLTRGADNGSVVAFTNGEDATTELVGFTLVGGSGSLSSGDLRGGGILCVGSAPRIEHNIIVANNADFGGGIYAADLPSPRIEANRVVGNNATKGGGLYYNNASPQTINNLIADNIASDRGGGIYFYFLANATVTHNTIADNTANTGGGISAELFSEPSLYNTIVYGNSATTAPSVHQNGATVTIGDSIIEGGWSGTTDGDIHDVDPLFSDSASLDFHLLEGSPAVDAGSNDAPLVPSDDLDGNARPICAFVDIGAYEAEAPFGGCPLPFLRGECNSDGAIGVSDAIAILSAVILGTPIACEQACDVNDDDALDVADAVYLLEALFVAGSPQPPAPIGECGLDPTSGNLTCSASVACP